MKATKKKFSYEAMKAAALSDDREVRKQAFLEYFESFQEFPSFLFDNEPKIDARLYQTAQDIMGDLDVSKELQQGVHALLARLPS